MHEGKRFRTKYLEVRAIASPLASPASALTSAPAGTRTRVGLIVPRFRQSAVDRNRLKRRLRELARTRLLPSALAMDTVIRIRPEAYRASFDDLVTNIQRAVEELQHWRATVELERPASEVITPAERQDT